MGWCQLRTTVLIDARQILCGWEEHGRRGLQRWKKTVVVHSASSVKEEPPARLECLLKVR